MFHIIFIIIIILIQKKIGITFPYKTIFFENSFFIKKIEILDSECKCFIGRLSRLVNCLNGYCDFVQIKIADNQQISNVITTIKNKLELENKYTIDKHKNDVINELSERGYSDEIINEWIKYI